MRSTPWSGSLPAGLVVRSCNTDHVCMTDTKRLMVSMRLPEEMVEQVDARAKNLGITRTQWYENMTSWVLENTYTIESRGGTP